MKSTLFLLPLIVTLTATPLAAAQKINGPIIGCLSEEKLSQVRDAIGRDDRRQAQAIVATGQCATLNGQEYSVADRGLIISEILVYTGGGSIPMFVSTESISEAN
ncbi:hypothetical protein QMT40_003018 [Parvibaculaceae bacterium PLY_AMNH_Bact1]|nr:hypothetical protein QMT40_003018 [Parvibaculaceae bacterium PLY_AMNH_Bact1]